MPSSPKKLHEKPSPMTLMTEEEEGNIDDDGHNDDLKTTESESLMAGYNSDASTKSKSNSNHRRQAFEIEATHPIPPSSTSNNQKSFDESTNFTTSTRTRGFREDGDLEDVSDILDSIPTTTKLYAGTIRDADLDEMLGIDMDDPRLRSMGKPPNNSSKRTNKRDSGDWSFQSTTVGDGICCIPCCSKSQRDERKLGNIMILNQAIYRKTGFCVLGPHYLGVLFTASLLIFASQYFIRNAYTEVGPISTIICAIFALLTAVNLLLVSCTDPGVVKGIAGTSGNEYEGLNTGEEQGWRFCDYCSVYQPPGAMHCPDCNVCVEGYDHHCPWMGICIGKRNYKKFMRFNITWLSYLIYAVIWVTAIGPRMSKNPDPNPGE